MSFLNKLKQIDIFKSEAFFLVSENYSKQSKSKRHKIYGTWPGFVLTVTTIILIFIYIWSQMTQMLAGEKDEFYSN